MFRRAVRIAHAILWREVQVGAARTERPYRLAERAARGDEPCIVRRILPHRNGMEEIVRVAMGEGGRVFRNGRDSLPDAEVDHLCEWWRSRGQACAVLNGYLD